MPRFRKSLSRILPSIVLLHVLLFILFWTTNSLFYTNTNYYLVKKLGASLDYIRLLLLASTLLGLWSAGRLFLHTIHKIHPLSSLTAWIYSLFALVYITFFYGSFNLLFSESPVQAPRLVQLIQYFRLILDPLLFLGAALLAAAGLRHTHSGPRARNLVLAAFAILWIIPLVFPPGSVYRGALPPRPRIIAHRGVSMFAPENTLSAASQAAALGVYGLETDIHISQDGQPFLMHDDTLKRTTDVAALYPGREKDRAETFTLAEVRRLNAGKWYVDQDPYAAIAQGKVSPAQVDEYLLQAVPTLAEELDIVRQHKLIFIFDLKAPPENHPFARSFFDITLKQIQQAGIDPQVWFLVTPAELKVIQSAAPAMKPTRGVDYQQPPSVAELKSAGYQIVNAEYGLSPDWIRRYRAAGLWVNLYTIDEPWQYSRLWLLGVDSTTTSNAPVMAALAAPILGLPYLAYLVLWTLTGLLGLSLIFFTGSR